MDERGGLQRVAGGFAGHLVRGEAAQFLINQRQPFVGGTGEIRRSPHVTDPAPEVRHTKGWADSPADSWTPDPIHSGGGMADDGTEGGVAASSAGTGLRERRRMFFNSAVVL